MDQIEKLVRKVYQEMIVEDKIRSPFNGVSPMDRYGQLLEEQEKLYNGLIKTYPIDSTIRKIKKDFPTSFQDIKTNDEGLTNVIDVMLIDKNELNQLSKAMNTYGWYLSWTRVIEPVNEPLYLRYEAKYDTNVSNKIGGSQSFIHITQYYNVDKISKLGLYPKSNSKQTYHPERIYLMPSDISERNTLPLIKQFYFLNSNKNAVNDKGRTAINKNNESYAVLEIKFNNVEKNIDGLNLPPRKYYRDPNAKGCFYTMENIHPTNIILKEIIDVDENGDVIDRRVFNKKLK